MSGAITITTSTADLLPRLWLLATTYPGVAVVVLIIICLIGTLCALCLVSMTRHELPLHQWEDDDEQHRAISRRLPLS